MSFGIKVGDLNFSSLLAKLNISQLQRENPPLYEVIAALIERSQVLVNNFPKTAATGAVAVDDIDYHLEHADASAGPNDDFAIEDITTVLVIDEESGAIFNGFVNTTPDTLENGRAFVIHYAGSGWIALADNANSTPENGITLGNNVDYQFLGFGGSALLYYDDDAERWRVSVLDPGRPIRISFIDDGLDSTITADNGTISEGSSFFYEFQQWGNTVHITMFAQLSLTGGPANQLIVVNPPYGISPIASPVTFQFEEPGGAQSVFVDVNGTQEVGFIAPNSSGSMAITLLNGNTFADSSDALIISYGVTEFIGSD